MLKKGTFRKRRSALPGALTAAAARKKRQETPMHQPEKSPGSGDTAKDIAPNTQDDIHMETGQVSFSFRVSRQATEKYSLHCHNFYEVYLFLEGDADYLVEGKKYRPTPDSLLLLSPHCFHGVRVNSDSPYRRYSIHFHPSVLSAERRPFLLSAFPSQAGDGEIYFEQADRKGIVSCFEALADCAGRPQPLQSLLLPIYVEALLARIVSMARDISGSAEDAGNDDTVSRILLYLNRHVSEPVTLDLLCERFYISKHHLNKVFRRATGTTVFDYLLRKRVILAQELLAGGMSAQEAAARAGFGDYSSFYRSYRRILGRSPLKDRGVLPSFHADAPKRLENVDLGEI